MVLHYRLCSGVRNISDNQITINAMDQVINVIMIAFMFGLIFFAAMLGYYLCQKFIDFLEKLLQRTLK